RAAPFAAPRHLRIRDAFLLPTVVVRREGIARLLRRFDKAMRQRQDRAVILDDERATLAAKFRVALLDVMLGFAEQRRDILIAPAAAAHLRPAVVIGRIAADIEHAVDRAGAAQHLAARPLQLPSGGARLALAEKIPIDLRVVEDAQHAGRDVDPDIAVGRPRFQQADARALLAQPRRHDAAGRTGAHDNIVRIHVPHLDDAPAEFLHQGAANGTEFGALFSRRHGEGRRSRFNRLGRGSIPAFAGMTTGLLPGLLWRAITHHD